MITGNDLYELVHSLTKAEKRHFKLLCGGKGNAKSYIRLFDAIDAQKKFDEAALLKKFRSATGGGNFSQTKKYLFEKILGALHFSGFYWNADSQVKMLIESAKLLRYKGLYRPAQEYLDEAGRMANEADTLFNRFYISFLRYNFSFNSVSSSLIEDADRINREDEKLLNTVSRHYRAYHTFRIVKAMQAEKRVCRNDREREELRAIIQPIAGCTEADFDNVSAKIYFNLAMTTYYSMTGHSAESLQHCRRNIELVKENPEIDNTKSPQISNYLSACLSTRIFDDFEKYLAEFYEGMHDVPDRHEQKLIFERWLWYSMQYLNYQGRFKEVVSLHAREEKRLKSFEPLTRHIAFRMQYFLAVACFFVQDYKRSWKLLSGILNNLERESDTYHYARIFSLIVIYERNDTDLLPYAIRSVYRMLLRQKQLYGAEKLLLEFIRQSAGETNKNILRKHWRLFRKKLQQVFEENAHEQGILYYFDFVRWLEQKSA